jgi:Ca2+-binding EF-hand superfamily protein
VKAARESDAIVVDHSACAESLHQISKYLSIRQLTLRDAVRPFDRANRGKVPVADFVRAIGCQPHTQVVADAYKDPYSGLVAYFQVEEDLNALKITKVTPPAVQAVIDTLSLDDVDVRKLFERYDRTRSGSVTTRQFDAVMNSAGVSPHNAETVEGFYLEDGNVSYLPFVVSIEKLRKERELTADGVILGTSGAVINTNELVEALQKTFLGRRVNVHELLNPRNGIVSREAFLRVLSHNQGAVNLEELNILADQYQIAGGDLDVSGFLAQFARPKEQPDSIDVFEIIEKVKNHLEKRRVRLQATFQKLDRLHTGEVSGVRFLVALQECGFVFATGEFKVLQQYYEASAGNVDWHRIVNDLDPLPEPEVPLVEKEPPKDVFRTSRHVPTANVLSVVARFAEIGKRISFNFYKAFTAMFGFKRGTIPQSELIREFNGLGGHITPADCQALFVRYEKNREFDYVAFCADLPSCSLSASVKAAGETPGLVVALRHYRAALVSKGGDARSVFKRFDPRGTGRVPTESAETALVSAGIQLNKDELKCLFDAFDDKVLSGRFLYREMDARAAKEVIPPDQIRLLMNPVYAEEEARLQLNGTLSELREKFAGRHIRPRSLFTGQTGLTLADIGERISGLNIILAKSQLDILNRAYGQDEVKGFDWDRFCEDSERSSIVGPVQDL